MIPAVAENADRPPPRIDGVLTYLGEAEELDFWRHLRRLMRVMIAINPDNIQRMRRAIVEGKRIMQTRFLKPPVADTLCSSSQQIQARARRGWRLSGILTRIRQSFPAKRRRKRGALATAQDSHRYV